MGDAMNRLSTTWTLVLVAMLTVLAGPAAFGLTYGVLTVTA